MDIFTITKEFGLPLGILIIGLWQISKYAREKDGLIKEKDNTILGMNDKYCDLLEKNIKSQTDVVNVLRNYRDEKRSENKRTAGED